jgi:hypothetical protein
VRRSPRRFLLRGRPRGLDPSSAQAARCERSSASILLSVRELFRKAPVQDRMQLHSLILPPVWWGVALFPSLQQYPSTGLLSDCRRRGRTTDSWTGVAERSRNRMMRAERILHELGLL